MWLLVNLQAKVCNFTESKAPPWVFSTFLKQYIWCQIAQSVSNVNNQTKQRNHTMVFGPEYLHFIWKQEKRRNYSILFITDPTRSRSLPRWLLQRALFYPHLGDTNWDSLLFHVNTLTSCTAIFVPMLPIISVLSNILLKLLCAV